MNRNQFSLSLTTLMTSLILTLGFSLPAMAMGRGGSGGSGGGAGGTMLHVSCIEWAATGGKGQHIHVQAFVENENGTPVVGAEVSMSVRRNGVEYKTVGGPTTTYDGLDGGVNCPGGPPGSGITADFCENWADTGYYDVEVLSVTMDGMTWDGVQPGMLEGAALDHIRP